MNEPSNTQENGAPRTEKMGAPKAVAISLAVVVALAGGVELASAIWRAPLAWEMYELAGYALLYLLPAIVAWRRDHHNARAIAALNVLAGWTIVGWIGALVWALTNRPPAASAS